MWHIYTMEYYSAIKKNGIRPRIETWMGPESVIHSEVSQKEKKKLSYINVYMWNLGAPLVAQMVKNLPPMQKTWARSLVQEDPLEKKMATHPSILAWKIP